MHNYNIYIKLLNNDSNLNLKELSRGLNRFIVKIIEKGDSSLISEIKDKEDLKPFRCTFLKTTQNPSIYKFNLFIISEDERINKALLKGLNNFNSEIDLNYKKFSFIGYDEQSSLSIQKLFDNVINTLDFTKIKFEFLSETTFRRNGFFNQPALGEFPFPEAGKIFDSLVKKWNKLIPEVFFLPEEEILKGVNQSLYHISAKINSETFSLGYSETKPMNICAFTGEVVFGCNTKDIALKKSLILLAIFSEWVGVGKKTSFGMGEVKVTFLNN